MTLVEGFEPDAAALARLLAGEGRDVTIAGIGAAPREVRALGDLGVSVRERADLDADPGDHDEAFLDVWTPEVAPRVRRLRAAGCRVRCLGDLVLERARVPTIGITGTAGKTTTATFVLQLLRRAGVDVHASTTARAENLWPTAELLPPPGAGALVLELTSSHLCFMEHSPSVAVVTSFWPDHVELHGSLERYRAAKETIVRGQTADDVVVVNGDDPGAIRIAERSRGRRLAFSATHAVEEGAFVRGSALVIRVGGAEREVALPPGLDTARLGALLGAVTAVAALDVVPPDFGSLRAPAFRMSSVGRTGHTALVDDGMAATPAKALAALRGRANGSIVLVAGGELEVAGLPVHASAHECALLDAAGAEARRVARLAVLFGPAAQRLAPLLDPERTVVARTVSDAVAAAGARLEGAEALVVSPMFPLAQEERRRIAPALRALARE